MHPDQERIILIQTVLAFSAILTERGTPFEVPTQEELEQMPLSDLIKLTKVVERVARTPL